MRGVSVFIFRSDLGDCTNGGVTSPLNSKDRTVVVFDPALKEGNFSLEECKDDPRYLCLRVVRRWVGTPNEYLHCEPMAEGPDGWVGPMCGGNYVYTSDSRFTRLSPYPLPVHDRYETPENYDALTR